ncbi:HEAT repeat domain-containing protein [Nodosilinea sp. FACHB-131]|uniref:HEAT repeat domain-containing protein n=1 Tax=Cyanophyceae TaxID=3028117 RepID=UPI0016865B46|nr:HEAT repeat domain-containing protein [Nodosilinea sp. FACHB-131]MBD1872759.1 HEAT repeat domain-containing protein [Nodosilinea sp. FACHB-131]
MDRAQLFDDLSNLPPAIFERLLFALKPPGGLIPGDTAPQMNRVKALLDWAEGSSGRGVEGILAYLNQLSQQMLPTQDQDLPNFQPYLQSLLENEDYIEWQEVYTPTTVEDRQRVPVQDAMTVSQHRFSLRLKLRAETGKPDQKEQGNQHDRTPKPQERMEQWDVLAGLRNYAAEHVVLIGKPGSGKSTSLERLLWEEAEKALHDSTARIPVLVKLRRCTGTIEGLIRDFLVGHKVAVEIAQIQKLLGQGRFLLLLDGLNELPERFRTEIANFRDRYHSTTPMIISTRELSAGGTLGIAKTLKMLPLTEPQMQEFVQGYLGYEGDHLFQQIQGNRLRKFAETPLLLWMLCQVFAQNGKVPDNLGLAFREFVQLHDQELQADAPADSRDQWHKLLRHLAFVMMQGKTLIDLELSIPREEAEDCLTAYLQQAGRSNPREFAECWLKDLLKYHLIQPVIQPNFEEHIEFRHQLIQEYYAAEYLRRLLPKLSDEQIKRDYLNLLKWTEAIALMLSLVDNETQALRVVRLALSVDLMLGARLSGETVEISQQYATQLVEAVDASELLKVLLLGSTRSKHVVSALKSSLLHENPEIRQKAMSAFAEIKDSSAINAISHMIDDENPMVRGELAMTLGKIGTELAGLKLKEWREKSPNEEPYFDIRQQTALWDIYGDEEKPSLFRSVFDDDDSDNDAEDLYESSSLSHSSTDIDLTHLVYAAKHESPYLRQFAVVELRNYREPNCQEIVFELLVNLINDSDRLVQQAAFRELQYYLETPCKSQAINIFLEQVKDPSSGLQLHALERIEKYYNLIDEKEIDAVLIDTANSSDFLIRLTSIRKIEKRAEAVFLTVLYEALNDEKEIRRKAAKVLGEIGHPDSSQKIVQAMTCHQDDDTFIKHAIKALGSIGGSLAIEALGRILLQGDGKFTGDILEALGDTKDSLAASFLLEVKFDSHQLSSSWLELKRVNALGKTADGDLLSSLKKALQTVADKDFLKELLTAILYIQDRCKFYNYEIWQARLAGQQGDGTSSQSDKTISNTITIKTVEKLTIMSEKAPIFNQQNATIGVNYAAEGSQQDVTQHIHASEQNFEILLTGYKQFIDELQQQNTHVTDETAIIQTINIEARRIDTRWQNFLNLQRLWNGGKKAAIKVGEHFVESNPWGKGAIAFLEGVSEDVE